MIEIGKPAIEAFERDAVEQQFRRFVDWWRAQHLAGADMDYLRRLWGYSVERAREIGIDDDRRMQISLYAAAFASMGELDEQQFLLVADILFEPLTAEERLRQIFELARQGAR